jgi:hypothetical protein
MARLMFGAAVPDVWPQYLSREADDGSNDPYPAFLFSKSLATCCNFELAKSLSRRSRGCWRSFVNADS